MTPTNGEGWRSPFLTQYCPVFANVGDGVFLSNIRKSIQRDLPWLQGAPQNDRVAVIVGGGPSLVDTIESIRALKNAGCDVVAVNNTARFLTGHGIEPDKHVLLDARASNARFVTDVPEYYIASQCAEETFDAAADKNVTLWHPHVEGVQEIIGDRETALIGGGTTVGLQSIAIMYALGYRSFHLFGYDSSYRHSEGHAYAQPENDDDEVIEVLLNGRRFLCARWMAHQADEFKNVASQLTDCEIAVYGDGLLPYMAQLLFNPPEIDAATYDMSEAPASWDFVAWLITAEMAKRRRGVTGPLRVGIIPGPKDGFRNDNLPVDTAGRKQLLDNVMRPAMEMIGAVEDPTATNGCRHGYMIGEICEVARQGEKVPKFEAPTKAKNEVRKWLLARGLEPQSYITVTLREADHWPDRNSNINAWLDFANECGQWIVFVRDTAKADDVFPGLQYPEAAKDIHIRAALYEKSKCNMFVSNGPGALGFFGSAPFLFFKPLCEGFVAGTPEWWARNVGVSVGEQLPWATERQRIIWADYSLEVIRAAWSEFNALPQTERS